MSSNTKYLPASQRSFGFGLKPARVTCKEIKVKVKQWKTDKEKMFRVIDKRSRKIQKERKKKQQKKKKPARPSGLHKPGTKRQSGSHPKGKKRTSGERIYVEGFNRVKKSIVKPTNVIFRYFPPSKILKFVTIQD